MVNPQLSWSTDAVKGVSVLQVSVVDPGIPCKPNKRDGENFL